MQMKPDLSRAVTGNSPCRRWAGELSAGAGRTEEGTVGLRKAKGRVETSKDRVRPFAESASEKLGPAVGQVREHLVPAVGTAREKVSPYAGKATKAALKGEIELPKKSHKLRNLVLFLGLGALAAAAVKKLLTPPEPAWQSTPTSGRDYSSAPAGTTSRPTDTASSSTSSSTSANGKTDAKPEPDASKGEAA